MKLRIIPHKLHGCVTPPPSKSLLHRELIARALSGADLPPVSAGEDVAHTIQALKQLLREEQSVIDCGESGSTLRFLLPVAMALGRIGTVFTGSPRLLARPLAWEYGDMEITRPLTAGVYTVSGQETSQIVSGLLMALPLCGEASEIVLTTPLVSRPYVEMTRGVLRRYGIVSEETAQGWYIPGGQRYCIARMEQEADWSAGAWFWVLNALGCEIEIEGLRQDSLQGDRRICAYCEHLPDTMDVSATPDLLPPLALLAALQPGKATHFTGAAFLRGKESDRLHHTARILNALGGCVSEKPDGLTVTGAPSLRGGAVDSAGDHRMAMLAGCAAACCTEAVELRGAACVAKSYPDYWKDYVALQGEIEVIEP